MRYISALRWLRGKELNLICEIMSLTCNHTLPRVWSSFPRLGGVRKDRHLFDLMCGAILAESGR